MARHGAHETRLPRVVVEHAADGTDGLAERAVRHHHVGPDAVEDVTAMHGVAAPLHEEHEQVEVAGNERLHAIDARQRAPAR